MTGLGRVVSKTIFTIGYQQANYDANFIYGDGGRPGLFRQKTVEVGTFRKNAFGLHDMHGNLWQWVQDCYKDTYADAPSNGQATSDVASCHRVLRGGSWFNGAVEVRSAERNRSEPNARSSNIGFRVARML